MHPTIVCVYVHSNECTKQFCVCMLIQTNAQTIVCVCSFKRMHPTILCVYVHSNECTQQFCVCMFIQTNARNNFVCMFIQTNALNNFVCVRPFKRMVIESGRRIPRFVAKPTVQQCFTILSLGALIIAFKNWIMELTGDRGLLSVIVLKQLFDDVRGSEIKPHDKCQTGKTRNDSCINFTIYSFFNNMHLTVISKLDGLGTQPHSAWGNGKLIVCFECQMSNHGFRTDILYQVIVMSRSI